MFKSKIGFLCADGCFKSWIIQNCLATCILSKFSFSFHRTYIQIIRTSVLPLFSELFLGWSGALIGCTNYLFRFPKGLALFFLPFYVPLGIVIMVIRIFFAIQLYLVLILVPKSWVIRRYVWISCALLYTYGVLLVRFITLVVFKAAQRILRARGKILIRDPNPLSGKSIALALQKLRFDSQLFLAWIWVVYNIPLKITTTTPPSTKIFLIKPSFGQKLL